MRNQQELIAILAGIKSISINGSKKHIPYDFKKFIEINLNSKDSNDK